MTPFRFIGKFTDPNWLPRAGGFEVKWSDDWNGASFLGC
jgi:hypothetical protein